jgi:hypothetical protein
MPAENKGQFKYNYPSRPGYPYGDW